MTTLQSQLQAVLDRYVSAYVAKDAAGCASVFLQDAALYSPFGPPALGRAAIAAQHVEWVQSRRDDKTLIIQAAGGGNDTAWCLSHYSEDEANGTSLMVFERPSGGDWMIRMCSLNSLD